MFTLKNLLSYHSYLQKEIDLGSVLEAVKAEHIQPIHHSFFDVNENQTMDPEVFARLHYNKFGYLADEYM